VSVITTHVLDLASGSPAAGVPVVLEAADGDGWRALADRRTDDDGRVGDLGAAPAPGRFRLRFDTAAYLGPDAFFPEVTVEFSVHDERQPLHVPLLLSPFGYSTYRGS
jgi:5-hydroxyisourate hydrolase